MDILTRLNWIDVLIIIIMFRTSYVAFQDGLSHEIFPLIGSTVNVIISLYYYHKLSDVFSSNIQLFSTKLLDCISFIAIFTLAGIVIRLVKTITDKIIKVTWHPAIEKIGGLIAGVARASVVTSIVLIAIALVPIPYLQRSIRDRSLMGMGFLKVGPVIYEKVATVLPFLQPEGLGSTSSIITGSIIAEKKVDLRTEKTSKAPAKTAK